LAFEKESSVKLVVFGAAGRTGRQVVERALGHGHVVTAFIHHSPLDLEHPELSTMTGDIRDFVAVSSAVAGQTGVAFALSGAGNHEPGIANVIHAMAEQEVQRLAAVSAAGTFARNDRNLGLAYRAMVATAMRSIYDDLEAMERRIMASDLDWAIVRPVGLTDEPASGDYRLSLDGSLLSKATRISRADVAALVVKALETDTYYRRAVVIAQ
jgi:putative NADH-flavin reductase